MAQSRREMEFMIRFKADASRALNQMKTQIQGINRSASQANRNMAGAANQANTAMASAASSAKRARGAFTGLAIEMRNFRGIIATLGVFEFSRQLINVTREVNKLEAKTRFTFKTQAQMADVMDTIRAASDRLGQRFIDMQDQFASFAAAAQATGLSTNTLKNIFLGVAEAATALQLPAEQTRGAFFALQQMMAKGKVNSEEFRLQLAERMPIALTAATRALGVTTQEFQNMLEKGELMSADFLPLFAEQLRILSKESLNFASQSLNAEFSRVRNTFDDFLIAIGRGGFEEGLKRIFIAFNDLSPVLNKVGTGIGMLFNGVSLAVTAIFKLVSAIQSLLGDTGTALLLIGGLAAAFVKVGVGVAGLGLKIVNVGKGLVGLGASSTVAGAGLAKVGVVLKGFSRLLPAITVGFLAVKGSMVAVKSIGVDVGDEFVSLGDIISYKIGQAKKAVSNFAEDALVSVKETVTSMIGDWEVFGVSVSDMLLVLTNTTFPEFYNLVISGWKALIASLGLAFVYIYRQGKYQLDRLVNEFKSFSNRVYDVLPEWMRGEKPLFTVEDLAPPAGFDQIVEEYRKEMEGLQDVDYAIKHQEALTGLLASEEDIEAIIEQRKNLRAEEARIAKELAEQNSKENRPPDPPDEDALRKAANARKKLMRELENASNDNDLFSVMPDSKRVVAQAQKSLNEVKEFYAKVRAANIQLSEQDLAIEKARIDAKLKLLQKAKDDAVILAQEEAIEKLRASESLGDQFQAALKQRALEAQTETGKMADFFTDTFQKAEDELADFLVTGEGNIKDFVQNVASELAKLALSEFTNPIMSGLSGGGSATSGGGFSFGNIASTISTLFLHNGGRVGSPTARTIGGVNPALFANAPRFHSGLKADEFPAILQRGETVVPRNQSISSFMGGGGINMPINIRIEAGNSQSNDAQANEEQARQMGQIVSETVKQQIYSVLDKETKPGGRLSQSNMSGRRGAI